MPSLILDSALCDAGAVSFVDIFTSAELGEHFDKVSKDSESVCSSYRHNDFVSLNKVWYL